MKSTTIDNCKILLGSFLLNFLLAGSGRLSPILFVESITYYNVDREAASFPYVLCFIVRNFSGLLAGYLEQIFGMQLLILAGGVAGAIGIGACFFATDITTVTILWGVLFGLGFCFGCQLTPVLLNDRFPESRSKAISLYYGGSTVGCLIVPLLFKASLNQYGLAGSFLLLSALVAHCIPASLLLNNSPTLKNQKNLDKLTINSNKNPDSVYTIDLKHQDPISEVDSNYGVIKCSDEKCNIDRKLLLNSTEKLYSTFRPNKTDKVENEITQSTVKKINFSFENFNIFMDPAYICILIVHALSTWVIVIFWTIIIDIVRDKGVEKEFENYFIICLPVAELVGRFVCGYIFDISLATTPVMSFICCMITSLGFVMFNFASGYSLLLLCEGTVSFMISGLMILQVALVHEFVEEKKRVMAMTCRLTLFAPCTLTVSPMIGYFRGSNGSYDIIIYIMSAMSFLSGCTTCCIPYFSKMRNKK